ncbi:MAG TPA: hypoxanthine phosphoribosyltransferase [Ignavibacteria bacterium]|nr:hypoxanthine phosphoribosyltransferase [Ignavibacteria bacterium]HQY50843.1 hypoxanthine phosphoribosyltransferase [Ignavibacteria bacterium]HRB00255.1 hypoxanthine phosphoribosyltransferase [Ignavibacteria bacterium]
MPRKDQSELKSFISKDKIQKRVKQIAKQINKDYKGKKPIFIGILNGSFIFLSDIIRELKIDCEIDFLKLSSYGDEKITSGQVRMLKELNCDIKDKDIIVVEDIVDSGLSVIFIKKLIEKHKPASLKFASLLFKKNVSNLNFKIDYIGFEIDNKFVVGYGLDYAQKYRNLNAIYVLKS